MSQAPEQQEGSLDIKVRASAPLIESAEPKGVIEWNHEGTSKLFEVGGDWMTSGDFFSSLGISNLAAKKVENVEAQAAEHVSEEIQQGDAIHGRAEAVGAMAETEQTYPENVNIFWNAITELLKEDNKSIFQLNGHGFSEDKMDGLFNTGSVGHKLAPEMEKGNVFLIKPSAKEKLDAFFKQYERIFANISGGVNESFSDTPSDPWSPTQQEIIPETLGFTRFLKIPHVDGRTEVRRIYFLFGKVRAQSGESKQEEMPQMDALAANIDQEVDKEGIEQMDKAA